MPESMTPLRTEKTLVKTVSKGRTKHAFRFLKFLNLFFVFYKNFFQIFRNFPTQNLK